MTPNKLAVIGQGYVGLPLAMRAAEVGWYAVGYDVDRHRIAQLATGQSFIDDVDEATIAMALANGTYRPTADSEDLAAFDVAVISVPTPLRDGDPDLSYVESAARTVGRHLRAGATVVLESTTYPGTTEQLVAPILEAESGLRAGIDFHLGYSPERIDPSNKTWTFVNTPKVVSGIDAESLAAVDGFYRELVDSTVVVSDPKIAELTKLLENTFRHVNVALVNELAMYANDLGINLWEAVDAASTKPFGYMRFTPGPGVGGHCLPVDPSYLSWATKSSLGKSFRFVELANRVNAGMPDYVVTRIERSLEAAGTDLDGARVLLLGLAYKPNTGDARESAAVRVAKHLFAAGAQVRAIDSHVDDRDVPTGITRVPYSADELRTADLVVLLVAHSDLDLGAVTEHSRRILDCQNRLRGDRVELL